MDESILIRWDNFGGGHWGVVGPMRAEASQWGGSNMALTRRGTVAPVSASRRIATDAPVGRIWGMRYAWGLDGLLYFVQEVGGVYTVRRFDPSDPTVTATVSSVGTVGTVLVVPDWAIAGGYLYLTVYGQATYKIDPTAATTTALTGGSGAAPAGRAVCVYGERMLVAGISDARFGAYPSRVVYSEAADFTDWPTLNFFDVGGDGREVRALVPMRDQCMIVLEDGQVWMLSGVPGVNASLRRYHGFDRGAGAIASVLPQHVAIDPSQTKAWMYDHANRGIARFNGASLSRIPGFGAPGDTRSMEGEQQGDVAVIGGPDEVLVGRVAIPKVSSETSSVWHTLMRHNGAWAAVTQSVLTEEG